MTKKINCTYLNLMESDDRKKEEKKFAEENNKTISKNRNHSLVDVGIICNMIKDKIQSSTV